MNKIKLIIVTALFCIIIYLSYLGSVNDTKRSLMKWNESYPMISLQDEMEDEIIEIVNLNIENYRNDPNQAYFVLKQSGKKRIFGVSSDQEIYLDDVFLVGCKIQKDSNANFFYIHSKKGYDTIIHRFELRDDLGYQIKE